MRPADSLSEWTALRRGLFYPKSDIPLDDDLIREMRAVSRDGLHLPPASLRETTATALGLEPAAIEPLPHQGTFHRLYIVRFDHAEPLILKVSVLSKQFRDYSFHVDAWVADESRDGKLRANPLVKIDTTRQLCSFDFAFAAQAPGTPLSALDDDEAATNAALRDLGSSLHELHARSLDGFGLLDVAPIVRGEGPPRGLWTSWSEYILCHLDRHVAHCLEIGAISGAEATRIEERFERSMPQLDMATGALLHGDLGSHNIFRDTSSDIMWLVDWEDALVGDPLYEIAFWLTFHPARRWPAALDGYGLAWPLPESEAELFWLYFLRVALMKTVLRHRLGYDDPPDRPPASRRIQLALSAIESPTGLPA